MNAREDGVIFLPAETLRRHGIDPAAVAPSWLKTKSAILDGYGQAGDIAQMAGGRAKNAGELIIVNRPGQMPLLLVQDKHTEAAETEDLVLEAQGRKGVDFEESRDRRGLPSARQFDSLLRQASEDYVKRMKRNRVTGHPRQPLQQFVKGLVTVPAMKFKEAV